jgi:hypothetical protein
MNGIGLIGLVLLTAGITLLTSAITELNPILVFVSLPFSTVGVLGLVDDLVLQERITKKILGIARND